MAAADRLADVTRLRAEISRMQRRTAVADALPVADALAPLFPAGGLRPGSTTALPESPSLLLALLGAASSAGSWCAIVGLPDLSASAAEGYGIDLDRLALIPRPGEGWIQAVASAAEVFPLVAVRPPLTMTAAQTARLDARLRDRGSALLVVGAWPGAEASLTLSEPTWEGVGHGHGLLSARAVTIAATHRRFPGRRRVRVLLPGPSGRVEPVATSRTDGTRRTHLTAVGA